MNNGNKIKEIHVYTCPNVIWDYEHYNADGKSCKCWDHNEKIMKSWGYKWNNKKGRWD